MQSEQVFPEGFLWGAATSSHQVEGGQKNDWSAWEQLGKINDQSRSGRACDHWNRFREDFDLAKSLGHTAHRFSIEWSRIEPRPGVWDEAAIDHYRQVVSALRERGIEPFVTLWHFSSPVWFMERGGWESGQASSLFSAYVRKVAEALPDVRYWIPVNEANVYALLSYLVGYWPPEVASPSRAYRVYRQLAAGHRAAYDAIHRTILDARVGCAHNVVDYAPAGQRLVDRLATRFSDDWYNHRWLRWVRPKLDFVGVNHYHRQGIRFGSLRRPVANAPQGQPQTDYGWQISPPSIGRALRGMRRYQLPIYVTENGLADATDATREAYITAYLNEVYGAIGDGVDVRGYLYWSLLDNFEWREGFSKRFGLIGVDFQTQDRTVRQSARAYAEICRTNRLPVSRDA